MLVKYLKRGKTSVCAAEIGNIEDDVQEGLARQAMKAAGTTCHDGADAAFCARGRSWPRIGDAYGVLVNVMMAGRGAMATVWRWTADADLFGATIGTLAMLGDGGEELGLNVAGELETDGVVEVVVAIANIARVGPGRLGVGGRAAGAAGSRSSVGGGGEPRRRLVMVGSDVVLARLDGAQRNVGRETAALVWMNFERLGPVSRQRPPAVKARKRA